MEGTGEAERSGAETRGGITRFEDDGFEPLAHKEKRVDDIGRERGGWSHYVNDPIGTPERLLADDGSVAAEYERKAWGQLEAKGGAKADTPIRLQGQYCDQETGLAYNRWRYYDACCAAS